MRKFFMQPLLDVGACLTRFAESPRPQLAMGLAVAAMVVTWFVYVPIHELLHVAGCVATGGSVTRLDVAPQYGGHLLARWFTFVESGGDYAGQLSGFDWKDSDLIYLATDFGPYVLTVLLGVPLLRLCTRRSRPILMGIAIVVGLAPFYNVIGDYYEMGSILTTRAATFASGATGIAFEGIRSDDIFKLTGDLCLRPSELGLVGPAAWVVGAALVLVSFALGIVLAFATYSLGTLLSRPFFRHDPAPAP